MIANERFRDLGALEYSEEVLKIISDYPKVSFPPGFLERITLLHEKATLCRLLSDLNQTCKEICLEK